MQSIVRPMNQEENQAFSALLKEPWSTGESPNPIILGAGTPFFMLMGGGAAGMAAMKFLSIFEAPAQVQKAVAIPVAAVAALAVLAFVILVMIDSRKRFRLVKKDRAERKVQVFAIEPTEAVDVDGAFFLDVGNSQIVHIVGSWVDDAAARGVFPNTAFELIRMLHSKIPLLIILRGRPLPAGRRFPARSFTLSRKGSAGPLFDWALFEGRSPRTAEDLKLLRRVEIR